MHGPKLFLILLFTSCFATAAFPQLAGNPDNWCRQGFFTRESTEFGVGFVTGTKGTKAYFYGDDTEKCPDLAACRTKSYVVSGDQVITNRKRGDYFCAWFAPAKGAPTVGWLKAADIVFPSMLSDAREQVWLGEWKYADNSITFGGAKVDGSLTVKGTAFWKGLGDNIHIGELDGVAKYNDGRLEYADGTGEYDCRASMHLATESFLIVADNMNCGGANVTFSGIYRKVPVKPGKK